MSGCGFDRRVGRYGEREAVLTIPEKGKWTWEPGERHKRSLVEDAETGEVISRGFPKFHNLGEVPEEDAETERAFAEGRVVLREKLDGSLIIRDVVDGKVCWRTRGSLGLGEFEGRVMRLVESKPPAWRDPLVSRGVSELFEYTGPQNRIVVRYDTEALTHLATVNHTPRPAGGGYWRCVRLVDSVRRWDAWPLADLADIRARVERGEMGDEGVVVACLRHDRGYLDSAVKLVKMKSAEYIRLHSLMTECTRVKVFDLLERAEAVGRLACKRAMENAGFDWEGMQAAREWAEEYASRAVEVQQVVDTIAKRLARLEGADRKTVALEMKALCADLMPGAFALAMVMHSGGRWQDNAAAMRCDVPVNVYRASREVAP